MELDVIFTLMAARADEFGTRAANTYDENAASLAEFLDAAEHGRRAYQKYTRIHSTVEEVERARITMEQQLKACDADVSAARSAASEMTAKQHTLSDEVTRLFGVIQHALQEFLVWQQAADTTYGGLVVLSPTHLLNTVGMPATLKAETIPRTLGQHATLQFLQLDDRVARNCREKDAEMVRLLTQRDASAQQLCELLLRYRAHILPLLLSRNNYAQSSCAFTWAAVLGTLMQAGPPLAWQTQQLSDLATLVASAADPSAVQNVATSARRRLAEMQATLHAMQQKQTQLQAVARSADARAQEAELTMRYSSDKLEEVVRQLNATTVMSHMGELPQGATYVHYCATHTMVQMVGDLSAAPMELTTKLEQLIGLATLVKRAYCDRHFAW
jgi:hypothetical protein